MHDRTPLILIAGYCVAARVEQTFILCRPAQCDACASTVARSCVGAQCRTARHQRGIRRDTHGVFHHRAEPGAQLDLSVHAAATRCSETHAVRAYRERCIVVVRVAAGQRDGGAAWQHQAAGVQPRLR